MNERDRLTLHHLVFAVRFLSIPQLARLRRCSHQAAARRARRLIKSGWVQRRRLLAQPIEIHGPLARWKPGTTTPDAAMISRAATLRYRHVPLREIEVVSASNRTLRHFGWDARPPLKRFQQTHDLGLSETFVYFFRRWPCLTRRCWVGEDCYVTQREKGEKVEDAQIQHPRTGETLLVVEFAGKYQATRVAQFIQDMVARRLPFVCF